MRVTPISSEEANEQSFSEPWAPGPYDFTVHDAAETTSQNNNDQIKLTLHALNRDGQRRTVFDYLVNTPGGQWKIRHFAESVGLLRQYEMGELDPREIIGRSGRCKLRIKPASGTYSAQNAVEDYMAEAGAQRSAPRPAPRSASPSARRPMPATAGNDLDDDIPF